MELDDLRRQWQQPEPVAPPTFTGPDLAALFKNHPLGPVEQMQRNAWLELGGVALFLLGSIAAFRLTIDTYVRAMSIWLIIICLLSGFYFRRKLVILASLRNADYPIRSYVSQQLAALRSLTKLYFQFTLWSLLPSMGIGLVLTANSMLQQSVVKWPKLGALLAAYAVAGWLLCLLVRQVTRWYLQRLYGRHLDRLKGQLRELDEGAAAA